MKWKTLFKRTHYKIVVHCRNCFEEHTTKVPIGTRIIGCKDKCPYCGMASKVNPNNYIN